MFTRDSIVVCFQKKIAFFFLCLRLKQYQFRVFSLTIIFFFFFLNYSAIPLIILKITFYVVLPSYDKIKSDSVRA